MHNADKCQYHEDVTDMANRLTAVETSYRLSHIEILRRLDMLGTDFRELRTDIKGQTDKHAALETRLALSESGLRSLKTKLNRILSVAGTLLITVLGAGVTVITRKYMP